LSFSETSAGSGKTGTFSRQDRLLRRTEFLDLSKSGSKIQDPNFIVIYRLSDKDRPRLGITVSKRVGNAVVRNRLKRLIREFFRKNRSALASNWSMNIIAKTRAAHLTSAEVEISLRRLFTRIEAG
jgi:ribonuclease P protein component